MTQPQVTLEDIRRAQTTIAGAIIDTPFQHARTLSQLTGADLWLKFENLQFTASFKERGALNKLSSLTDEQRQRGVIAMSAGNHAQGVAYHARRLGIPATIVMPEFTPITKVANTKAHGADVILEGKTLADASAAAHRLERERGLVFIHPYDDPQIIAGQGTLGLELAAAKPDLDAVLVPVGGGGLAAGVATAMKALTPNTEIIGVEAELFPAMHATRHRRQPNFGEATIAEGIAVTEIGKLSGKICEGMVDDVVLVSEADIERAIFLLLTIEKTVVEGAGAASLAAVLADPTRFKDKRVAILLCGGNIDARLLSNVILRELSRNDRLCRIEVNILDAPGQLAKVTGVIGEAGGNIVEVRHSRLSLGISAKHSQLDILFEARDQSHAQNVIAAIEQAGMSVTMTA